MVLRQKAVLDDRDSVHTAFMQAELKGSAND